MWTGRVCGQRRRSSYPGKCVSSLWSPLRRQPTYLLRRAYRIRSFPIRIRVPARVSRLIIQRRLNCSIGCLARYRQTIWAAYRACLTMPSEPVTASIACLSLFQLMTGCCRVTRGPRPIALAAEDMRFTATMTVTQRRKWQRKHGWRLASGSGTSQNLEAEKSPGLRLGGSAATMWSRCRAARGGRGHSIRKTTRDAAAWRPSAIDSLFEPHVVQLSILTG